MKWACGIDPGLNGAFVLTDGKKRIEVRKMPLIINGKEKEIWYPDVCEILRTFDSLAEGDLHVFLERAVPFAMGTKSAFNYGRGFAVLEIALQDLDIPFTMVEANKWTKVMHAGIKKDLKPKAKSAIALRRLFPTLYSRLFGIADAAVKGGKINDGVIDALLIAGFGLRVLSRKIDKNSIPDF